MPVKVKELRDGSVIKIQLKMENKNYYFVSNVFLCTSIKLQDMNKHFN